MSAPPHPEAKGLKAAPHTPSLPERRLRLIFGALITFFPVGIWSVWNLALGDDFLAKQVRPHRLDVDQIYVWLLIGAGIFQLIAVFILRKSDQKPRDWISILSLIDAGLSIALTIFFWMHISGIIFRGA
jgi:hypothetical protein